MRRLAEALARRAATRESVLVSHPDRMRAEVIRAGAVLVVLAGAASAPLWTSPGSWGDVLAGLVLAVLAGGSVVSWLRAKMAYRAGWLDGRAQMVAALSETMRRGYSLEEWLEAELERDFRVIGARADEEDNGDGSGE
jgi:hypothetical protein